MNTKVDEMRRVAGLLACINPDCARSFWVKMLMAVKSEFGEAGRDIAEEWSARADSYNKSDFMDTWKSIKEGGNVTIATLVYEAKQHGCTSDSNNRPTPLTLEEIAQREARRKADEEARETRRQAAAVTAVTIWNAATGAPADHLYLKIRGIQSHGAKTYHGDLNINGTPCDGMLMLPMKLNQKISSLQFIAEDGNKLFLPGGEKGGFMIGKLEPGKPACICEGFATGASIHEATVYPVIVAFDAGNLCKMAVAFRAKNPDVTMIICADDDNQTKGNPGFTKAQEAARKVGGLLALPDFGENKPDNATDFNDMHKSRGAEAVKQVIDNAKPVEQNTDPAGSDLSGLSLAGDTSVATEEKKAIPGLSGADIKSQSSLGNLNSYMRNDGAGNAISFQDIENNGVTEDTKVTRLNLNKNSVAPRNSDEDTGVTNSIPGETQRPAFLVFDDPWSHDGKEYLPGVWYFNIRHNREGEPTMTQAWVCSPLHVEADTADEQQHNFGRLLRFRNTRGTWRIWAMPMELLRGSGEEMRGELLSMGVEINPVLRSLLGNYLQTSKCTRHVHCALQVGWCRGGQFVLPDSVIGPDAESVIFQTGVRSQDEYTQAGTMEGWKAGIAGRAVGNPQLMLAVSASFSGPLLKKCNMESGGIHWVGDSSTGKTTGLDAACATWGGPNMKRSWRATSNGIEGAAAMFNDCLLALDEISECDPKEVGSIVYNLGNGTGKQRATRAGGARSITRWKCFVISTGERTIETTMTEGGHRTKAGHGVRLLDIPVNGKYGMWDDLHGMENGAALSDAIKREAVTHYGHAGREFLEKLTRDERDMCKQLEMIKSLPGFQTRSEDGQAKRAAGRFALLAFAGELATEYGITGWPKGEALKAAAEGFKAWLEMRGGNEGNDEHKKILRQVLEFIDRFKDGRFSNVDPHNDGARIHDRAGYWRDTANGREYLFNSSGMKEALKGFDFKRALDVLQTAGVLPPTGSDGKRATQIRIEGQNQRLYVVRYDKLEVDHSKTVPPVTSCDFDGVTENMNINKPVSYVTPVTSGILKSGGDKSNFCSPPQIRNSGRGLVHE